MLEQLKEKYQKRDALLSALDKSLTIQSLTPGCFDKGERVSGQWIRKPGVYPTFDYFFNVKINGKIVKTLEYKDVPEVLQNKLIKG